ncbi:MAG: FtsQ-type POTRA domain-containing protein [bacterium]|jgi:cell division septal protein FtsQ
MWFNKSKSGDSDKSQRGESSKINTRRDQRLSEKQPPLPKIVWIPLVGLLAIGLGALLTWKLSAMLFWENPNYTIQKLEIRVEGATITSAHVREYMNIGEGSNMFSSNLYSLRSDFLRKAPIAKSVKLQRHLPHTLSIEVVERIPIARLGRWGSLAVDREGCVFNLRAGGRDYPVIIGYADTNLKPGGKVDQSAMNAIELVDICNRSKLGEQVKITSIEVGFKDHLEMCLTAGERVKVGWEDMDQKLPDLRQKAEHKLITLASALRASEERGRRLVNLDLTFSDQYIPAQEY